LRNNQKERAGSKKVRGKGEEKKERAETLKKERQEGKKGFGDTRVVAISGKNFT